MNFHRLMSRLALAVVAGLMLAASLSLMPSSVRAQIDGMIATARLVLSNSSGVNAWRLRVGSTGLVVERTNAALTGSASGVLGLVVDNASGGLGIPVYTTAELNAMTPASSGIIVCDETLNTGNLHGFCTPKISTGATIGAWTLY